MRVSTRSVNDPVKAMGVGAISRTQVSRLRAQIDERVQALLYRSIEGDRPYLRIETTYANVR